MRTYVALFLFAVPNLARATSPQNECVPGEHQIGQPPVPDPRAPDIFSVTWKSTVSDEPIVLEVHREWAPIGVDRFHQLLIDNYYNCASFFRVVPNFVVQFGIAAEPEETSKWSSINIQDDAVTKSNLRNYVSFATAGPNTRTTQVFINLRDNKNLDGMGFAPFGMITKGMDVVDSIMNPTPDDSGGIDQSKLSQEGNEWVVSKYPNIDMILSTNHE